MPNRVLQALFPFIYAVKSDNGWRYYLLFCSFLLGIPVPGLPPSSLPTFKSFSYKGLSCLAPAIFSPWLWAPYFGGRVSVQNAQPKHCLWKGSLLFRVIRFWKLTLSPNELASLKFCLVMTSIGLIWSYYRPSPPFSGRGLLILVSIFCGRMRQQYSYFLMVDWILFFYRS